MAAGAVRLPSGDDGPRLFGGGIGRALGVSLALHLILLMLITLVRLPAPVERPLPALPVSLVTLAETAPSRESPAVPVPRSEATKRPSTPPPPPPPPKPQPRGESVMRPEPVVQSQPAASARPAPPTVAVPPAVPLAKLPPVPSVSPPASQQSAKPSAPGQNLMKDVLRGIELPPEAPRLGEGTPEQVKPMPSRSPASHDVRGLVDKLQLPEVRTSPSVPVPAPVAPKDPSTARRSATEELEQQLQALRQLQEPASPSAPAPKPQPEVSAARPKTPVTTMNVPGMAPGFSRYLALVQRKISGLWVAPPVDASQKVLEVVIRFRLHRSGVVSDVEVERSSGNEYYDAAGKRAVLSAYPLPPFPKDLAEPYLDAHFSFSVGETAG